jgi:hypothetical protein
MSQIVDDAIAAELATLTRVAEVPTGDLGYGVDLWCIDDLTEDMAEVDPFSVEAISQALIRRLTTPRGSLPDDDNYGFDLRGYCNRGVTLTDLQSLTQQIAGEVRKDDRVSDATVIVAYSTTARSISVSLTITPTDPLGTFTLVFAVTNDGALIQSIT